MSVMDLSPWTVRSNQAEILAILTFIVYIVGITDVFFKKVDSHRKSFVAEPIINKNPEETWSWLQQRNIKESSLKDAIANNIVRLTYQYHLKLNIYSI